MTPRIEPLDPKLAPREARAVLDAVRKSMGMLPNVYRVMARSPSLLQGYAAFAAALEGGVLPKRLREQVALAVATRNGCEYCLAAHRVAARLARLSPQEIEDAQAGRVADPKEAAGLALAIELLEKRGDASDGALRDARMVGFTDEELVELTGHVAINLLTNIVNRFARTPVDFGRAARAAAEVIVRLGRS